MLVRRVVAGGEDFDVHPEPDVGDRTVASWWVDQQPTTQITAATPA
ncbi:hypothetical protein [Allokutzneria albata]|uniref:Uncharacterized protein n=1 Tax=Allokutzneria albata TaxID=211114 RepID=A0A1G9WBW2_ALLAB|nr:hypothetical protein [Allokutzneria albata]SDM81797.1 hypothetical protein SAMN04489726_3507 [Allokutzneria albata]